MSGNEPKIADSRPEEAGKEDKKKMFEAAIGCLTKGESVYGMQESVTVNGIVWKLIGSTKMIKECKGVPSFGYHISFVGACSRECTHELQSLVCQRYLTTDNEPGFTVRKALDILDEPDVIRHVVEGIEKDFYECVAKLQPFT